MEPDQDKKDKSEPSTPENPPSSSTPTKEEGVKQEVSREEFSALQGDVTSIKSTLESLVKKPDKQEEPPKTEEPKDKTPESPKIEVPGIKFISVRKRGGRIVRRPVKEEKKKEEVKK